MKLVPRGILKAIILKELRKKPKHGYELIKDVEKTTKFWKPSPGSMYPLLKTLEKERLIKSKKIGRKKVYFLSKSGLMLIKKIEKNREKIRKEMIKTFSQLMGINETTLNNFFKNYVKSLSVELKKDLNELILLTIKAKKKGKEKEARRLIRKCVTKLSKL